MVSRRLKANTGINGFNSEGSYLARSSLELGISVGVDGMGLDNMNNRAQVAIYLISCASYVFDQDQTHRSDQI